MLQIRIANQKRLKPLRQALAISCLLSAVLALACTTTGPRPDSQDLPDFSRHDLQAASAITRWDEALPLGNGIMGILVWGDGQPLKLSLDRADLWDLRPVPEWSSPDYRFEVLRDWIRTGRSQDIIDLYENPYSHNPGPTKIPAGRIELVFDRDDHWQSARLSLSGAIASVTSKAGSRLRIFQHATEPVGLLEWQGAGTPPSLHLIAPAFAGPTDTLKQTNSLDAGDLARLGYPAPQVRVQENAQSFLQQGWGDFRFAVAVVWQRRGDTWQAAWSIASSREHNDPLQLARSRAKQALASGFERALESHSRWWKAYWSQARVYLPNPVLERQWYLETYKFGCIARRGAPPISLQAIWTADTGQIPPWKGDFHHDLNTELSYWPCYSGNHLEEGLSYLDWLWDTAKQGRTYTRLFFEKPGLCVPMTSDLEGRQMGGWTPYTHSPTITAWLAQHFYLHWRYSMDRDFLRERAYPYLREAAVFLEAVSEQDAQGHRYLPLSASPEIHDNRLAAWFPATTNYDLALMRWLFNATAELAAELGQTADQQHWRAILAELPELSTAADDGRLLIAPDTPLPFSHRHFSHLMAIHPLGLINWEDGPAAQRTIRASLAELDRLGPDWWCGYSYSWLASLAARARDGERAEKALEIFSTAFCSSNSFHVNGDQTRTGYSKFTYRPFTLEGNMAAAAAVQEMLLQSHTGVLRLFPALPSLWQDVSFHQLRCEGAFLVSASMRNGSVERVDIRALQGGLLRLEDPFKESKTQVKVSGAEPLPSQDGVRQWRCRAGASIKITANP